MDKFMAYFMVIALLVVMVLGSIQCAREISWCINRDIVEYRGKSGDTLIGIGNRNKPIWMSIDEWCKEVRALNGMHNSDIYAGEIIKIYVWNAD